MPQLIETLASILRIESVTGNESKLCDWVEAALKNRLPDLGGNYLLERIGNAVVCRLTLDPSFPTLAMAGHLDTVAGDQFGDKVQVLEDRIVGLGASDMKSGVAVMLEILRPEILQNSRFNLVQVYYDGEEGPDIDSGIHRVFARSKLLSDVALCLVLEPTDRALQLGCMGSIHARITFRGSRAHSARPWQGENAIHKSAKFLEKIGALQPRHIEIAGLPFTEVISITQAKSGNNSRNVVPDIFELNLNMRLAPSRQLADAKLEIMRLVDGEATVEFIDAAPSCPVPESNPFLEELQTRYKLERKPKQAYTDVAVFSAHGIPAVNFGPGLTSQAHQHGEYVLSADLLWLYEILASFISKQ